jgi:L-Ala-D/L-Glu epimerase
MPVLTLSATVERWPVAGSFVIARGAKTHVDVVVAAVSDGRFTGRGEGTAIYYKGETAEGCAAAINAVPPGIDRTTLQTLMPHGAARNALDCALWDLAAQQAGVPLWQLAGLPAPMPLVTAFTISLADPVTMEGDARARADMPLLKLKLAGEGDYARVAAVRKGAPNARLIVDANEAWTGRDIAAEAAALAALGVEMVEQPVKAGQDHLLDGVVSPIPFVADESCQDRADLPQLVGRYAGINIKLDKAGGLTEGIALAAAARAMGFDIMVGCMLSTSLGIAPAFLLGGDARWVDLDGALLLAKDRAIRLEERGGRLHPPRDTLGSQTRVS